MQVAATIWMASLVMYPGPGSDLATQQTPWPWPGRLNHHQLALNDSPPDPRVHVVPPLYSFLSAIFAFARCTSNLEVRARTAPALRQHSSTAHPRLSATLVLAYVLSSLVTPSRDLNNNQTFGSRMAPSSFLLVLLCSRCIAGTSSATPMCSATCSRSRSPRMPLCTMAAHSLSCTMLLWTYGIY